MERMRKYPRTPHLSGSALQRGDGDVPVIDPTKLRGNRVVYEEG